LFTLSIITHIKTKQKLQIFAFDLLRACYARTLFLWWYWLHTIDEFRFKSDVFALMLIASHPISTNILKCYKKKMFFCYSVLLTFLWNHLCVTVNCQNKFFAWIVGKCRLFHIDDLFVVVFFFFFFLIILPIADKKICMCILFFGCLIVWNIIQYA
jgi:hypothetical protein